MNAEILKFINNSGQFYADIFTQLLNIIYCLSTMSTPLVDYVCNLHRRSRFTVTLPL